jgi:hypothetical protein
LRRRLAKENKHKKDEAVDSVADDFHGVFFG